LATAGEPFVAGNVLLSRVNSMHHKDDLPATRNRQRWPPAQGCRGRRVVPFI